MIQASDLINISSLDLLLQLLDRALAAVAMLAFKLHGAQIIRFDFVLLAHDEVCVANLTQLRLVIFVSGTAL